MWSFCIYPLLPLLVCRSSHSQLLPFASPLIDDVHPTVSMLGTLCLSLQKVSWQTCKFATQLSGWGEALRNFWICYVPHVGMQSQQDTLQPIPHLPPSMPLSPLSLVGCAGKTKLLLEYSHVLPPSLKILTSFFLFLLRCHPPHIQIHAHITCLVFLLFSPGRLFQLWKG